MTHLDEDLKTRRELATLLGVSPQAIEQRVKKLNIKPVTVNGKFLYSKKKFLLAIQEHQSGPVKLADTFFKRYSQQSNEIYTIAEYCALLNCEDKHIRLIIRLSNFQTVRRKNKQIAFTEQEFNEMLLEYLEKIRKKHQIRVGIV